MKNICTLLIISISVVSCSPQIRYIGKSLDPTQQIEVFVSEQSIKRPFEYIGKGYLGGFTYNVNPSRIQKKAEEMGREKGADAVLIMDYYNPNTGGTNIVSAYRTDSMGKGVVTTGHTTVSPTASSGYHILYLKYKP